MVYVFGGGIVEQWYDYGEEDDCGVIECYYCVVVQFDFGDQFGEFDCEDQYEQDEMWWCEVLVEVLIVGFVGYVIMLVFCGDVVQICGYYGQN